MAKRVGKKKNPIQKAALRVDGKRNSRQSKTTIPLALKDIDRIVMGIEYEQGLKAEEIAKQFNISSGYIYAVLNSPEVKEVRNKYRETVTDRLFQSFTRNETYIDDIIDSYIYEARKKTRIQDTDLKGLFSVFNTLVQSKIRLKELTLKEQELNMKEKMLSKGIDNQDTSLLDAFTRVINGESNDDEDDELQNENVSNLEEKLLLHNKYLKDLDKRLDEQRELKEQSKGDEHSSNLQKRVNKLKKNSPSIKKTRSSKGT